jgi:beta-lactam-binding protein with PASTA domain
VLGVVPGVLGKLKGAAAAEIAAAGFVPNVVEVVAIGKPLGRVFDQDPAGGSSHPKGSVVTLRVAKLLGLQPALVTVPNLIGLTPAAAQAALAAKGLGSDGKMVLALGKPHNRVYSQNKASGSLVPPGTEVRWRWNP